MTVFIGHESALAILRSIASHGEAPPPLARLSLLDVTAREVSAGLSGCPREAFVQGKAHVLVPSHAARSKHRDCVNHIWSHEVIPGSFWALGDGIYVSSPEFLFL